MLKLIMKKIKCQKKYDKKHIKRHEVQCRKEYTKDIEHHYVSRNSKNVTKIYSCDKCSKSYTLKTSLDAHIKNNDEIDTECHICHKMLKVITSKAY